MRASIAICDDETLELHYVKRIVEAWSTKRKMQLNLACHNSAEAFLFAFDADKDVDILLLDIQMKGMDGLTLAQRLRAANETLQIVFITGYADHAAQGYDVSALHYLIKPVSQERLFAVLDRAIDNTGKKEPALVLDIGGESVRVLQKDILYAEAVSHAVHIRMTDRDLEVKMSLAELEENLDGNAFTRCHRAFVVGLRHVARIAKADVVFDDGQTAPLSRRLTKEVHQAFIQFYKGVP